MKKLIYSAAIVGLMMTAFASCKKDKNNETESGKFDGKIEATIESGAAFDTTKALIKHVVFKMESRDINAETTLNGNKFSLTLNPVPAEKLWTFFNEDDAEILAVVSVSDATAKYSFGDPEAYDGDTTDPYDNEDGRGKRLGRFIYGKMSGTAGSNRTVTAIDYYYLDKPVTIKGTYATTYEDTYEGVTTTYAYEETYDLNLATGWNRVYYTETYAENKGIVTMSTKPVSGLKWYFAEDWYAMYDNDAANIIAKTKNARKHRMFKK